MAHAKHELQDLVLQLPSSLRERAEQMAAFECVSLNLFVAIAVAERLQRLQLQLCLELSDDRKLDLHPYTSLVH
jgi:hypothetical protein